MAQNKLTCLIIEDEPIAAEVLKDYISEVSFLELKAICRDAIYAIEELNAQRIDVIFLDIHLPKIKGLDFLKTLNQIPQTILTTAYDQYAIDAFDIGVVDYLLKPIEFSRFLKAVNKLDRGEAEIREKEQSVGDKERDFHFFNVNKKKVKVYFDEVLYIESLKDYSRIVTKDNSLVIRAQIGSLNAVFDADKFIRIHRSYIIAIDKTNSFSNSQIEIGGINLPIGRSYKALVTNMLDDISGNKKQ